ALVALGNVNYSISASRALRKSTQLVMAIFLYHIEVEGFKFEAFDSKALEVEAFDFEAFEIKAFNFEAFEDESFNFEAKAYVFEAFEDEAYEAFALKCDKR
nr:hypothetical protein [Tanacetum cinerariifolium]